MEPSSKIKIVENSNFFANLELKGNKVWLVWGNPNCKRHNEALVKSSRLNVIHNGLGRYLQKITDL